MPNPNPIKANEARRRNIALRKEAAAGKPEPMPSEVPLTDVIEVDRRALYKFVYCLLTAKTQHISGGGATRVIAELFHVGGEDLQKKLDEIKITMAGGN